VVGGIEHRSSIPISQRSVQGLLIDFRIVTILCEECSIC